MLFDDKVLKRFSQNKRLFDLKKSNFEKGDLKRVFTFNFNFFICSSQTSGSSQIFLTFSMYSSDWCLK